MEHHGEMLLFEMARVSLFFLTGGAEIVNSEIVTQGNDKDWYLTSWNRDTDTVMSSLIVIKICRDFKEF